MESVEKCVAAVATVVSLTAHADAKDEGNRRASSISCAPAGRSVSPAQPSLPPCPVRRHDKRMISISPCATAAMRCQARSVGSALKPPAGNGRARKAEEFQLPIENKCAAIALGRDRQLRELGPLACESEPRSSRA